MPDAPEARAVLCDHWGRTAEVGDVHRGLSRLTWQVAGVGWLARESVDRRDEVAAESHLLGLLQRTAHIRVPVPVPDRDGALTTASGTGIWTLRQHLVGAPLADAPGSYRRLAETLAPMHADTASLPRSAAVVPEGLVERAARVPALSGTFDAAEWIRHRVPSLAKLPRQVIHGDYSRPNVLFDGDDPGVLDWELASYDSPLFDVAHLACGMVVFTNSDDVRPSVPALLDWYAGAGGRRFSWEELLSAMVAGKLATVTLLHDRVCTGQVHLQPSVDFVVERVRRLMGWKPARARD